jgi:hypothetical protein
MHRFLGIRAKNCGIVSGSPFHNTVDVGMIDGSIDNKVKS